MDIPLGVTLFLFFVGLSVGSFLNVVIFRIPLGEGVVGGRSRCRACAKTLSWLELIPVVSYIVLRGKCLACRAHLSLQYPLVELATGISFVVVPQAIIAESGFTPLAFLAICYLLYVFSVLTIIFVTDLKHFIIPDEIVLPAIAATIFLIAVNRLLLHCMLPVLPCSIVPVLLSLSGAAFFLLLVTVSGGVWMGLGDVKLAALMGLFLGFAKLLAALMFSFFAGSVVGALLVALGRKTIKDEVPFGAFLAPATVAAYFYGEAFLASLRLLPWRW